MMASNHPKEDKVLPAIRTVIKAATKKFDPKTGSKFYISTTGYGDEQWGLWTYIKPDIHSEDSVFLSIHVTAGLHKEGAY